MNALYDILNIVPLSLLFIIVFGTYAGIPAGTPSYILCTAFTVWITTLRHMKTKGRLRSIGIVSVFLTGLSLAAKDEYKQLFFEEYFWTVWILCFSAAAFAAGMIMDRNIWIKRAAAAVMLICLLSGPVLDIRIEKSVFSLVILLLLMRTAEEIQRRWKKSGCPDMKEHITRISPFFLAVTLAVFLIPAPKDPFDWQFAKNLYQNAVSVLNRFYGSLTHSSDDYGNMGFSENSRFFSSLGANDDMVLCIEADRANLRDLRLVGCMSSEFDGTGWIFDSEGQEFSRKLDTMETATAVRKYTTSYRSDYLETVNLRCENLYYNTRYVFSPAKIRYENTRRRNKNIRDRNGCILSDKKMYYQDVYTVSAYTLNYANPHLEELLNDASPIAEDEWSLTVSGEGGGEACTYEDYLGYRNGIHSRSYGVSDEVADILDMIQDGSQSRYETAKRLEAYLAGMEYTTDCPPLPDDISSPADFLDFFLLSSRKGYCMHFATAYVLMANEMGIPCRYVQGYNVPRDADGRFIVRQSGAHSWPEVYFDNAGWVAFEPTPGFTVSSGWMTKEDYEADADDDKYKEYLERYKKENETFTEPDVPEEEPVRTDPLIFIIPVSAVIGFLLIFYIISRILSARRYRRMSPDGRFRYVSQKCLRFLGYLGLGMNENETLSEYRQRLITLDRQDITDFLGFIPAYERALYSDSGITESDVGEAEKTNSTLRELVNKKLRLRLLLLITNQ